VQVLVTGGAGFIGAHVCRELVRDGRAERVLALDDLSTGLESNLAGTSGVELVRGSILDEALVGRLTSEADAVVHLAAVPAVARSLEAPRTSHDVNATGTVVVLEAARTAPRPVIVASSSSVYGKDATLPAREDQPTRPISPYAASKLAAESYALAYARSFGLPVLAFRFFNVYGPLQRADHAYAAVIPAFVSAACAGKPLTIHGDGRQSRDFTYVGDVAAIIGQAVDGGVTTDGPVNLAFGTRTTLLTLADEIEALVGRRVERIHTAPRPGDVHDSQADTHLLRTLFPSLRPTPLREGLRATVEWFAALGADGGAADGTGPDTAVLSGSRRA
jgi:UDP-glucose 4-epimerase